MSFSIFLSDAESSGKLPIGPPPKAWFKASEPEAAALLSPLDVVVPPEFVLFALSEGPKLTPFWSPFNLSGMSLILLIVFEACAMDMPLAATVAMSTAALRQAAALVAVVGLAG